MRTTFSNASKLPYWLQQELKDPNTGPLIMDLGVDLDTNAGRQRAFKTAFGLKNQRWFRNLQRAWPKVYGHAPNHPNHNHYTLTV